MAINTKMYINGKLVEGKGEPFDVICPGTGEVITQVKGVTEEQAEEALQAAQAAFDSWAAMSLNERVGWMKKLIAACREKRDEFIDLLAQEGGTGYKDATGGIDYYLGTMEFFADEAKHVYDTGVPEYSSPHGGFFRVMRRPVGVVVAHLAWNAPMNFMGGKLGPAMASGCTCVIKPSSSTPLTALKVGEIAAEIGVPAGAFNIISGPSSVIGKYLNSSKIPAMITCIGSTKTGIQIMNEMATSVKKVSLELGGNAPCIIMPDSDLDDAVAFVTAKKIRNSGQSCGAVNRIFVHESLHDEFAKKLTESVSKCQVGWGKDVPDAMGPVIDIKTRDALLNLCKRSVDMGAKVLYGCDIPDLPDKNKNGSFMNLTILDNVTDDMPVAKEEQFGPIYAILTYKDLDEVIRRSNDTEYGLASYLFTHDSRSIAKCVEELKFGKVVVNNAPIGGQNLPHTGIKQSGVGSLFSKWSLEEYFVAKLAAVKP